MIKKPAKKKRNPKAPISGDFNPRIHTGDAAGHTPSLWPYWFSRCSNVPLRYQIDNRTFILDVKGPG